MIDTHAHLNSEKFSEDLYEVIEKSKSAGVEVIIIPACENKDFEAIEKLTKIDFIYSAYGIHPHNASEYTDEVENRIIEFSKDIKSIAIGEIGLDYFYDFTPKDVQKDVFTKQIRLAKELKKPIIVHNRDSDEDLISILKQEQNGDLTGVLHCYSSDLTMLKQALDLGLHISFTGNITFKNLI